MKQIKEKLAKELTEIIEMEVSSEDIEIPDSEHGDYAYPAMKAAAQTESNPREIAEEVADELQSRSYIKKIDVAGPGYINIYLTTEFYIEKSLKLLNSPKIGVEQKKGKILLEFSSPNIAKPMHIGHVRNNCVGDSLQRIMRYNGYEVTSENYLGDWGSQFGKAITSFKHFGSEEELEENPMQHIYNLYVKFHNEVEGNPELEKEAAEWSRKIEEGDEEAKRLWEKLREITIKYNKKDYQRMDIKFDRITGESKVVEEGKEIIERGLNKEIFKKDDDGSVYVDFEEENIPNTIVKKADGTTLYLTRDIANIEKREKEGFDHNFYVVASEQDLHFQQLFQIAEEFGITNIDNEHISYGMLDLGEKSMSSREGNIITLSDLLDEATAKAEEKIRDKENIESAEKIGLGAVKYANLSVSRNKDIEFNWEDVLAFEGDSGPYLQYSNTRAKSILEKTEEKGELKGELEDSERKMIKKLTEFPEKVESAADKRDPVKVASYLSELCEEFNTFYHKCPVLDVEEDLRKRRLKIVELFVKVSDQGLELLGIKPLEQM